MSAPYCFSFFILDLCTGIWVNFNGGGGGIADGSNRKKDGFWISELFHIRMRLYQMLHIKVQKWSILEEPC